MIPFISRSGPGGPLSIRRTDVPEFDIERNRVSPLRRRTLDRYGGIRRSTKGARQCSLIQQRESPATPASSGFSPTDSTSFSLVTITVTTLEEAP
jgi:hypothetical protein